MKKKLLVLLCVVLVMAVAMTACSEMFKKVDEIKVVDGTMTLEYQVGDTPDFSGVKVEVTYSNGKTETIDASDLTFSALDTTTAGEKTVTVTYEDVSVTVTVTVKEAGENPPEENPPVDDTPDPVIFGVELPTEIVLRDSYKEKFNDKTQAYVVGDDNPYYFYLKLAMFDVDNGEPVTVDGKDFPSIVKVYLLENGSYRELTADLATYVAVDAAHNSYDFTEEAIGKTFKLVIRPDSENVPGIEDVTRYHEVTVVDGYNVYNAWELNYLTNDPDGVGVGEQGESLSHDSGTLKQLDVVLDYLANKTGKTKEEVNALSNSIKGMVFHGNITVTMADIPSEYVYSYTKDGEKRQGFFDSTEVFKRSLTASNSTFAMYGNYYSIFAYGLPLECDIGYGGCEDPYSNSKLFDFMVYYTDADEADYNHKNYNTKIENLALRGDDPNSNDAENNDKHMRGLIAISASFNVIDVYNVNVEAFYTSFLADGDDLTVNLDKVYFYNAWQTHIFAWNTNYANNDEDAAPHANYQNIKLNITDSYIGKCGGPVILSQSSSKTDAANKYSGMDVVVKDSELYSYVTGQEAWFVAVGQTQTAGNILALDAVVTGTASAYGMNATYLSKDKIQGVTTVNMIYVNMGTGVGGGGYEGSFTSIKTNDDGTETVTTGLYMKNNDNDQAVPAYALNQYIENTGGLAPVFQNSAATQYDNAAGIGYYDGEGGLKAATATGYPDPSIFTGDYITLYFMGMGIMFEYYH